MSRLYRELNSFGLSRIYEVVLSQRDYFEWEPYWDNACKIYQPNFSEWDNLEFCMNADNGCPGIHIICLHLHLGLSKKTSPYSIIMELKVFFEEKLNWPNVFTYLEWGRFEKANGPFREYKYKINLLT